MASITVTVPTAAVQRVLDAVCATYGYSADSGLTQTQFAQQHLVSHVKEILRNYESRNAGDAAKAAAAATADQVQIT